MGEKSAGRAQYVVGLAQLLVPVFMHLDALRLGAGHTGPHTGIDLCALDPFMQGVGRILGVINLTADHRGGYSLRCSHETYRTLTHFGGILLGFAMAPFAQVLEPQLYLGRFTYC